MDLEKGKKHSRIKMMSTIHYHALGLAANLPFVAFAWPCIAS